MIPRREFSQTTAAAANKEITRKQGVRPEQEMNAFFIIGCSWAGRSVFESIRKNMKCEITFICKAKQEYDIMNKGMRVMLFAF